MIAEDEVDLTLDASKFTLVLLLTLGGVESQLVCDNLPLLDDVLRFTDWSGCLVQVALSPICRSWHRTFIGHCISLFLPVILILE